MGGYLVEAFRIGSVTILVSYGVKCLGKVDMSRIIKMTGMSASGICVLRGCKHLYENPPQWVVDVKGAGQHIGEVANQIKEFDLMGLFGLN